MSRNRRRIESHIDLARDVIQAHRQMFDGETIVCVGCGPSLKGQDLSQLDGRIVVLTNWAHKAMEQVQPAWSCHVVTDDFRMAELREPLVMAGGPVFCAPCKWDSEADLYALPFMAMQPAVRGGKRINFDCEFSGDVSDQVWLGRSVIFSAIQVASYLGAARIACIGMDMTYTGKGDHFDPEIKAGNWSGFRYETHGKGMLEYASSYLRKHEVELVNATDGGAVDCLPRMTLSEVFGDG